jgi:4-hydroxybenzoate polyprenyltransferase
VWQPESTNQLTKMKLIAAFLRLVRLPNLLFIAITQLLFQYCIYYPLYKNEIPAGDNLQFILIMLASVFIAAAGYIINDYFDINIDQVNKPDKLVVDKIIHRRWAIAWHLILSFIGIVLTALALPFFQKWYLVLANIFCVILLWFYSTTYKKSLLIGNLTISILTAWTILILFFSKVNPLDAIGGGNVIVDAKFFRLAFLYAAFAFISSLIREAIKDMEDLIGDERYGCRTMPVVWGLHATKIYVAVWLIVLILLLVVIQVYILQYRWWWPVLYSIVFIIAPLINIFRHLFTATSPAHFHSLSNRIKFVMFAGILSMIFFGFYL